MSCCFNSEELFYTGPEIPGYLIQSRFTMVLFLVVGLCFCLPTIISNFSSGCTTGMSCSDSILMSVSLVHSFKSKSNIDLMYYLTVPAVIITFLLLLLKTRFIARLRYQSQEKHYFPDSCALLCELPFNHLMESFLVHEIDRWWVREEKGNK